MTSLVSCAPKTDNLYWVQVRWDALFWDFTRHRMVVPYRRFETTCPSHLQGSSSPTRTLTAWPLKTAPTEHVYDIHYGSLNLVLFIGNSFFEKKKSWLRRLVADLHCGGPYSTPGLSLRGLWRTQCRCDTFCAALPAWFHRHAQHCCLRYCHSVCRRQRLIDICASSELVRVSVKIIWGLALRGSEDYMRFRFALQWRLYEV